MVDSDKNVLAAGFLSVKLFWSNVMLTACGFLEVTVIDTKDSF